MNIFPIEPLESRIAPAGVNPTTISIADAGATQSTTSTPQVAIAFSVTLDQPVPAGDQVVVHFHTSDGTAHSSGNQQDFNGVADGSTGSTLTFAPGDTTKSISVNVRSSMAYQPQEAFQLVLDAGAQLQDSQGRLISTLTESPGTASQQPGVGTGTINPIPLPTITASSPASVQEGQLANFTISLQAKQYYDVSVHYSSADQTGVAGTDYVASSGTVTIPAGSLSVSVPVTTDITNNANGKTFGLHLSSAQLQSPDHATLAGMDGTATIVPTPSTFFIDPSTTSVTIDSATNSAVLTVDRTGSDLSGLVSVDFTTVNGTAMVGTEYSAPASHTVSFGANQTTGTISIPILHPAADGGATNFSVNLQNAMGGSIQSGNGSAAITIAPTTHFALVGDNNTSAVAVNESAGTASFTIQRTGNTQAQSTVSVQTSDGTGVNGTDYTAYTQVVSFSPGQTSMPVSITILDPQKTTGSVSFNVSLTTPTNADILNGQSSGVVNISDNDVFTDTFSINGNGAGGPLTVNETAGTATMTVTRSGDLSKPATVQYSTVDGTAVSTYQNPDYTASSAKLTFLANEAQKTIAIPINSHIYRTSDSQFMVALFNPTGGNITSGQDVGTVIIHDTNAAPTVTVGNTSLSKAASGPENAQITVSLSAADNSEDVMVSYATKDGTAVSAGASPDYTASTGVVTIQKGQTTATISVPITTNDTASPVSQHNFTVQISNPTPAPIQIAQDSGNHLLDTGTATIVDPFTSVVSVANASVSEGGNEMFAVSLSHPYSQAVILNYTTQDGAGPGGATHLGASPDYTSTTGSITIPAGQLTSSIAVPTDPTSKTGGNLTFGLQLQVTPQSNLSLSTAAATGTIVNTAPTISIANAAPVAEVLAVDPASPVYATFPVTLSAPAPTKLTVQYETVDGTAVSSGYQPDFKASFGTLTFDAGTTTPEKPLQIQVLGGAIQKAGNFDVQLLNPLGATLGASSAMATLTGNGSGHVGASVSNAQGVEGGNVTFTVTLTDAAPVGGVTFNAIPRQLNALGASAAVAGTDFQTSAIHVTIPKGDISATFNVPVNSTSAFSTGHSFAVDLTGFSSNAQAAAGTAVGTILDDHILITPQTMVWHDVDGDIASLTVSKGNLLALAGGIGSSGTYKPSQLGSGSILFSTSNTLGGTTLQELNVAGAGSPFAKGNIAVVAQPVRLYPGSNVILGNSRVDVGFINANNDPTNILRNDSGIDLGSVYVQGDLARIDVGDTFADPGLSSLTVYSLGSNISTLPLSNNQPIANGSTIVGPLIVAHIITNLEGTLNVIGAQYGSIGAIEVDGSLHGAIYFTGNLNAGAFGSIDGSVTPAGSTSNLGQIFGQSSQSSIGALTVFGKITGGSAANSGEVSAQNFGRVNIGGLVGSSGALSGSIAANGSIGSVLVRGSVVGGTVMNPVTAGGGAIHLSSGEIAAFTSIGAVHITHDLVGGGSESAGGIVSASAGGIQSVVIDGNIVGGAGLRSGIVESFGGIGAVAIGGSISGGALGDSGEVVASGGAIKSLFVGGQIAGGAGNRSGSVQALSIGQLQIGLVHAGQTAFPLRIVGGAGVDSGWIEAQTGIASATVYGTIAGGSGNSSGRIQTAGAASYAIIVGNLDGTHSAPGSANSGSLDFAGGIQALAIAGQVEGGSGANSGYIHARGTVQNLTIGYQKLGSPSAPAIEGNSGVSSGVVEVGDSLNIGNVGSALLNGGVSGGAGNGSGGLLVHGNLASVQVNGDIAGGSSTAGSSATALSGFLSAASIGKVVITGNIAVGTDNGPGLSESGLVNARGTIQSIAVSGALTGSKTSSGSAFSGGTIEAGGVTSGLALGSVSIRGGISGGQILAGISLSPDDGTFSKSADAQIGAVTIGGIVNALNIAAGIQAGSAGLGTMGDAPLSGAGVTHAGNGVSRIASVVFTGNLGAMASGAIEAQQVVSVTIGSSQVALLPGASNDLYPGVTVPNTQIHVFEV